MLEVYQLLNGAHMASIGSRMQRRELVCVSAVHFVTQLPNKEVNESHPALFCCYMDWRSALFRSDPGGTAQLVQLLYCGWSVPGSSTVERGAAIPVFCARVRPLHRFTLSDVRRNKQYACMSVVGLCCDTVQGCKVAATPGGAGVSFMREVAC